MSGTCEPCQAVQNGGLHGIGEAMRGTSPLPCPELRLVVQPGRVELAEQAESSATTTTTSLPVAGLAWVLVVLAPLTRSLASTIQGPGRLIEGMPWSCLYSPPPLPGAC